MKKKFLAILLSLVMVISLLPATALAAGSVSLGAEGNASIAATGPDENGVIKVTVTYDTQDQYLLAYAFAVQYDPAQVEPYMDAPGAFSKTARGQTTYYGVSFDGMTATSNFNSNKFVDAGRSIFLAADANPDGFYANAPATVSVSFYFKAAASCTGGDTEFSVVTGMSETGTVLFTVSVDGNDTPITALSDTLSATVTLPAPPEPESAVSMAAEGPDADGAIAVTVSYAPEADEYLLAYAFAVQYDPALVEPYMDAPGAYSKTARGQTTYYGVSFDGLDATSNFNSNSFVDAGRSIFLAADANADGFYPEVPESVSVTFYFKVLDDALTTGGTAEFKLVEGMSETGTVLYTISIDGNDTPITALVKPITASATWAVQKRDPALSDFTVTAPAAVTYSGSPVTVAAPVAVTAGVGEVTVKYNGSTTAPTKAGSYAVTFDVAESATYNAATGFEIGTLVINKKPVTISGIGAADKAYDGSAAATVTGTAAIDGLVTGDNVSVQNGTAAFADAYAGSGKTVTFTGFVLTGSDALNYTLTAPASATASITAADPTGVSVTKTASVAKGGNTLDLSTLVTGADGVTFAITSGDAATLSGSVLTTDAEKVGDVVVTATVAAQDLNSDGTPEYNSCSDTITVTVIDKVDAGVSVNNGANISKTYGDAAFAANGTVANPGTGTGVWTWSSSNESVATVSATGQVTILGAGSAIITAHYESDSALGEASVTLTVAKATVTVTVNSVEIAVGQSAPAMDYTVTGLVGSDTLSGTPAYTYEKDGEVTGEVDTENTGTYVVSVSGLTADSAKYNEVSFVSGTLSIIFVDQSAPATSGGSDKTEELSGNTVDVATATITAVADTDTAAATAEVTAEDINKAATGLKSNPALTIDVQSKGANSVEVNLDAEAMQAAADAKAPIVVKSEEGSVTLSDKAISALAAAGGDGTIQLTTAADGSVKLTVTVGGKAASVNVMVEAPADKNAQVAVDGKNNIIEKSFVKGGKVYAIVPAGTTIKAIENKVTFPDVKSSDWFAPAVDFVGSHEIFRGDDRGYFDPKGTMTRAMMATVFYRIEGEPKATAGKAFTDVASGMWYSDAIAWASEVGVMNGYGETFGPNDPITREQMAALLYNYTQLLGADLKGDLKATFSDSAAISSWAVDSMNWAVGVGLFQGDDQGRLNPIGNASRAEVATLIQRYIELLVK